MADSLQKYLMVLDVLENNERFLNLNPKGEPQLGKRGLYPSVGGVGASDQLLAMLWVLNQSDGKPSLLDIAERSGLPFGQIREAARILLEGQLLTTVEAVSR